MKRIILILAAMISIATVSFAQGKFTLKGNIRNADGDTIYLNYGEVKDSKVIKKGKFTFKGTIDKPYENGILFIGKIEHMPIDKVRYMEVAIEPGKITADIDANEFRKGTVNGGKTQQEKNELKALMADAGRGGYEKVIKDFIQKHPDSYVSLEQLRTVKGRMDYKELKELYAGLSDNVKKYGNQEYIKNIEDELKSLEAVQPGHQAPDFTANDINGKPFTLSSLKGHVTIIDFWASWCVPCRQSNTHMLELYKKYRAKGLEMVYVSDDDNNPDAWKKAVEKDNLKGDGFHHVLRGLKIIDRKTFQVDKTNDISNKYAIHYLPTKYLIDQQGRIVGKVESDEWLEQQLERLLGKAEYPFTINGKVANAEGKNVALFYGYEDNMKQEQTTVKNGQFQFKGVLAKPYNRGVMLLGDMNSRTADRLEVALEEGTFTIDAPNGILADAIVKGGQAQADQNEFQALIKPYIDELMKLDKEYNKAKNDKQMEAIKKKMQPFAEKYGEIQETFYKTHPDSYLSPTLFAPEMGNMSYEEIVKVYNSFSERVRLYGDTKEIEAEIATLSKTQPGAVAPDFTADDINGKPFTFSSLKGKVVILDFWASWCVPCRKSNPHMKALFEKYHDKGLEMVYVSDDDGNPNACKKAVEKDGLIGEGFHHVLRGFKMDRATGKRDHSKDISDKYAIHYLPTKYLIDREGRIVCKISEGEDELLDKKLAELLK
ncbi:MAG: redoxin domain-containing protein [Prevotella sp.]|nr:redoxin domain-containing protein [Prevotella sp.]